VIYHIILRSYKEGTTPSQIEESQQRAQGFTDIEGVTSVVSGPNLGIAPFGEGLTHATILTMTDADAVKRFIADPFHREAATQTRAITERSVIVDIEVPD
jgi:phage tail protein X